MAEQTYNGFPNVETWRVQLHLSNDEQASRWVARQARRWAGEEHFLPGEVAETFEAWLRRFVEGGTGCMEPGGNTFEMLARDTVQAALARVDWAHLARLWIDAAEHEIEQEARS
ncbi:MAG: hypothetical protein EBS51_15970 [Planctomycetia bacterium]|nr:hypothetical protein [Planctomycetia bacterium]